MTNDILIELSNSDGDTLTVFPTVGGISFSVDSEDGNIVVSDDHIDLLGAVIDQMRVDSATVVEIDDAQDANKSFQTGDLLDTGVCNCDFCKANQAVFGALSGVVEGDKF